MPKFKDRVFGAPVDPDIIDEFDALAGGREISPLTSNFSPKFKKYLGDRTPFVRMWCAVNVNEFKDVPKGKDVRRMKDGNYVYMNDENPPQKVTVGNDKTSKTLVFTVNENNEKSYDTVTLESMGDMTAGSVRSVKQLSDKLGAGNPYLKPAAGITSVTSKTQGALGALQYTTVEFQVHNRHDFENIFLAYFLRPGAKVFVDYGWSDKSFELYDPTNIISGGTLTMEEFDSYLFNSKDGFVIKNNGYMNTAVGTVLKYDSATTANGSFQCSLEMVSTNTGLIDKEISDDNNLKFIFGNAIDQLLVTSIANDINEDTSTTLNQILQNQESLTPIDSAEISKKFFNALELTTTIGKISDYASRIGIFYQDLAHLPLSKENANEDKEMLFISYGKFEDMFLNNLIAGTITETMDGRKVTFTEEPTKDHTNIFDSRTSYISWDQGLYNLQNAPLEENESLHTFIVPSNWDNSYNARLLGEQGIGGEYKDSEYGIFRARVNAKNKAGNPVPSLTEADTNGQNPKYLGRNVMPLRDLFISVPLITKAFNTKKNVNDALTFIFDSISNDSNRVWNIKFKSSTNAKAGFSFFDSNLTPRVEPAGLVFDVTSGETIVKKSDLKFTTPKAGLSSIIAISNLNSPQKFDQQELSALNNLNLLNRENKDKPDVHTSVRSLPLYGETNPIIKPGGAMNLDFDFFKSNREDIDVANIAPKKNIQEGYDDYKEEMENLFNDKETKKKEELKKEGKKTPKVVTEIKKDPNTEYAKSFRDAIRKNIRNKLYNKKDPDTISPVLPIELDLTILGNTFLKIGDQYNINYLPSQYKDKTYFQIVGIEDTITPQGWDTSYTSVMRVLPQHKPDVSGDIKPIVIPADLLKSTKNQGHEETNELQTILSHGIQTNIPSHERKDLGIEWQINKETFNTRKDLTDGEVSKVAESKVIWEVSKLGDVSKLGNVENLAFAYAVQSVLLSDNFIKNLEVHAEVEEERWKQRRVDIDGLQVCVSYGDLNMQEIIEAGYDGGNGFFGDEVGLDVQELAVIKAINEATPNNIKAFSTLNSKLIDQNFGGTDGVYWINKNTFSDDIKILRIPTAIRFARLDKEDKEPVIHLKPVSDDFSVFPLIKIPMYLFEKTPDESPYSNYTDICDQISTHYKFMMDALQNDSNAPLNPNEKMKRQNP
tara:strand:- start:43 stop:3546 length:3504 start_codon:yes stop_codon:yes gene_type:complete